MKHRRKLLMAGLAMVPLMACEDQPRTIPGESTGTIEGTVRADGTPQQRVTVSIAGPDERSATTDSDGSFSFTELSQGSYEVALEDAPKGIDFPSSSKSARITDPEQTVTLEFSGEFIRTAGVTGTVTAGGEGIEGATVRLTGPEDASATTDASGAYRLGELRPGEYTLVVDDVPGDVEMPSTDRTVTLEVGETRTVELAGEFVRTASISGAVTAEGEGIEGATVRVSGPESASATTDASGAYRLGELRPGEYTLRVDDVPEDVEMPSASRTRTLALEVGETQTVEFSGEFVRTAAVSGAVVADRVGIEGATVRLTGPESATTTTDPLGAYSFQNLRRGEYTVLVDDLPEDVEIPSTERTVSPSTGQVARANFIGQRAFESEAKVVIQEVRDAEGNVADMRDASGHVTVTLSVHEANDRVTRISLLVDGNEVSSQSFEGSGSGSAASFTTTMGFSTTRCIDGETVVRCDESESGQPQFLNGERELTASLDTERGGRESARARTTLEFSNRDRMVVRHRPDLGGVTDAMEPDAGVRYWGGGDVVFEALPVMYSGRRLSEITVSAEPDLVFEDETASEFPFLYTAPYVDEDGGDVNRNAVEDLPGSAGHSVKITAARDANGVNIDLAPMDVVAASGIHFDLTPPDVRWAEVRVETAEGEYRPDGRRFADGARFVLDGGRDRGVGIPDGETAHFDVIRDRGTEEAVRISGVVTTDELDEADSYRYVAEVASLADRVGNSVDPEADRTARSGEFGVDRTGPTFQEIRPGEKVILNGRGIAEERRVRFTVIDPDLADGSPGSGIDPALVTASVSLVGGEEHETVTIDGTHPAFDVSGAPDYVLDPSHPDFFGDGAYEVTVTASDRATSPNEGTVTVEYILATSAPLVDLTYTPSSATISSRSVERRIAGVLSAAGEELGNAIDPEASTITITDDGSICERDNAIPEGSAGVVFEDSADVMFEDSGDVMFEDSADVMPEAGGQIRIDRNEFSIGAEFDETFRLFRPEDLGGSTTVDYCVIVDAADSATDNEGEPAPNKTSVTTQFSITWN